MRQSHLLLKDLNIYSNIYHFIDMYVYIHMYKYTHTHTYTNTYIHILHTPFPSPASLVGRVWGTNLGFANRYTCQGF